MPKNLVFMSFPAKGCFLMRKHHPYISEYASRSKLKIFSFDKQEY